MMLIQFIMFVHVLFKGAVENILDRSSFLQLADGRVVTMNQETRDLLLTKMHSMTSKALRCLALAYKEDLKAFSDYDGEMHHAHALLQEPANYTCIESDLIFVGMLGLRVSILFSCLVLCMHCNFLHQD